MLQRKSRRELVDEANILGTSFSCVYHNHITYIPADCVTGSVTVTPPVPTRMWLPLTQRKLRELAALQFNTMFGNETELRDFGYMVEQASVPDSSEPSSLLIRTRHGLRELKEDGKLHPVTGVFIPNTLPVILNDDSEDKAEVLRVLTEWLDSEEEATSLLRHCATALAPHWSAVKYVLLIGDGRNGKSLLLSMLRKLFGPDNCSHVTRQNMSEKGQEVLELQGKLLNIVFDGTNEYLKDSANEKSLVAGEPVGVRQLYRVAQTIVQTNGLFIEGLNKEPKAKDKSSALQARLVRFWFPNTYPLNPGFHDTMTSERMVGALLSLLIEHYVSKQDVATMLAPTRMSIQMQMTYMLTNSVALQFIQHTAVNDPLGVDSLVGLTVEEMADRFKSWRISENDLQTWSQQEVIGMFRPLVLVERKSKRTAEGIVKIRIVTGFKEEVQLMLETQKELEVIEDELVDGGVHQDAQAQGTSSLAEGGVQHVVE